MIFFLTIAMNGVYAHPFVYNTNYQERFVEVLRKVKSTKNRILFIVSINMDKAALQLFAGAVEWDWVLYFGYVIIIILYLYFGLVSILFYFHIIKLTYCLVHQLLLCVIS